MMRIYGALWAVLILAAACSRKPEKKALFTALPASETGLHFNNELRANEQFNMFRYMYFYNGAGVATADFNNDSLPDVFFASNQGQNKLYLNKGGLSFTDVSTEAGIAPAGTWSTGISVADVNQDGLLDIYVCKVGNFELLKGRNELLICQGIRNGIPVYKNEAARYGLDFQGFSTQSAFLDYDRDGDLDMYLLNHAVHHSGMFAPRAKSIGKVDSLSGDRLYRNDNGFFTNVAQPSGIQSTGIGYGLGLVITDVNNDGWPDIYIGNDFHENDYLYINQQNGRFADELPGRMRHTSQYSMGVDAGDVNNDGWVDLVSMDMLPKDPYILKRSLGEDQYDVFNMKVGHGFMEQYTRNNLQLNRGQGFFSEIGLYAGMYATDWSWSPLFYDYNADGKTDLFITNGIPKRLNDMDYVSFVGNEDFQQKILSKTLQQQDFEQVNRFPEIKLPNQLFINRGNARFYDDEALLENSPKTFSNGAAMADFDGDGDVDLVVNNINDEALVYRNNTASAGSPLRVAKLYLQADVPNKQALGARLLCFRKNEVQTFENQPVRGFQSSSYGPVLVPLPAEPFDSVTVVWPSGKAQRLVLRPGPQLVKEQQHAQHYTYPFTRRQAEANMNLTWMQSPLQPAFTHTENDFIEFDREPLIPWMVSREGPAMAVADANGDGREDLFLGNARRKPAALYLQQPDGTLKQMAQPALSADSAYEDVAALWADVNKDGAPDLLVASGGNEFYGNDSTMQPRLYLNDGRGLLKKQPAAFAGIYGTFGTMVITDFDGDAWPDLFVGARAEPFAYGKPPRSYFLRNHAGKAFVPVNNTALTAQAALGMVTGAVWADLDGNGHADMAIAREWSSLQILWNEGGQRFTAQNISGEKGLWRSLSLADVNADGKPDLVAGNQGLNSRLSASAAQPVRLYYADFDGNGTGEQLMTYYLGNKEICFANKDELLKQMPVLKKKFLYAEDFAKATLDEIFPAEKRAKAVQWEANYMANACFVNQGKRRFVVQALPWQAQLWPLNAAAALSNGAVFLGGNFYAYNIQLGRCDAWAGAVLQPTAAGPLYVQPQWWHGQQPLYDGLRGQVRSIVPLRLKDKQVWVLGLNHDAPVFVSMR